MGHHSYLVPVDSFLSRSPWDWWAFCECAWNWEEVPNFFMRAPNLGWLLWKKKSKLTWEFGCFWRFGICSYFLISFCEVVSKSKPPSSLLWRWLLRGFWLVIVFSEAVVEVKFGCTETHDNVEQMFRLWMLFGMLYLFLLFNCLWEVVSNSNRVTSYLVVGY